MRVRSRAVGVVVALAVAALGVAGGPATAQIDDVELFETVEPEAPPSDVAPAEPAAEAPPPPPPAGFPVDGPNLGSGSSGPAVEQLQHRLAELRYDPGAADGSFGQATTYAVWAFQKIQGLPITGRIGPADRAALANPFVPGPQRPDRGPHRVVVNLTHQLLYMYRNGELELISHISSGNGERYCVPQYNECRVATTPVGDFEFQWYRAGWDNGPLGNLWNPLYFTSAGHAVHGSQSVPLHPASHGCVRIPMHTADRFPTVVGLGWPISIVA